MIKNFTTLVLLAIASLAVTVGAKATSLTCSPAPCVTSVVDITSGSSSAIGSQEYKAVSNGTHIYVDSNSYNTGNANSYCAANAMGTDGSQFGSWYSSNQGATWAGGCVNYSTAFHILAGDPHADFDTNGNLFRVSLGKDSSQYQVIMWKSTDSGVTWGTPTSTVAFTDTGRTNPFNMMDYDDLKIDQGNNCIYASVDEIASGDAAQAIIVGHACPPNYTWSTKRVSAITTTGSYNFAHIAIVAGTSGNTEIHAFYRYCGNADTDSDDCGGTAGNTSNVYDVYSTDGGVTWGTPVNPFNMAQGTPDPFTCFTVGLLGSEILPNTCNRIDTANFVDSGITKVGTLYKAALYSVNQAWSGTFEQIKFRNATESAGTWTWSSPTTLDAHSSDQFFPCISATGGTNTSSSTIGVAWLDTRNGTSDNKFDAYGVVSKDGGSTWGTVYRLSPTSGATSVGFAYAPGEFLGDYTGCTWNNGIFYYVYPDTTSGITYQAAIVGLNP